MTMQPCAIFPLYPACKYTSLLKGQDQEIFYILLFSWFNYRAYYMNVELLIFEEKKLKLWGHLCWVLVILRCDIFAFGTSSAERLRDLDLSINKTL